MNFKYMFTLPSAVIPPYPRYKVFRLPQNINDE